MNVDEEFDEFKEENKRWTWASELALKKPEDGDLPRLS